jgi:hypothetical protein
MGEFHEIWVEQCEAARDIREAFGLQKAPGYLIGEKLLNFLRAADEDPASPASPRASWRRSSRCSTVHPGRRVGERVAADHAVERRVPVSLRVNCPRSRSASHTLAFC